MSADTYYTLLLSLVHITDVEYRHVGLKKLTANLILSLLFHVMNLLMQMALIFLVYVFVTERREDPLEDHLSDKLVLMQTAMDENKMLNASIPLESDILNLCWRDHSVRYSQSLIIFLWALKITPELVEGLSMANAVWRLPRSKSRRICHEDGDSTSVFALTPFLHWIIQIFIVLPKIAISILVAIMGAKFLMMAWSIGVLILKALTLGFITSIDELLVSGLLDPRFKRKITSSSIKYEAGAPREHWLLWGSTTSMLIFNMAVTFYCTHIFFAEVQEFRQLCNSYENQFHQARFVVAEWRQSNCTHCGFSFLGHTMVS